MERLFNSQKEEQNARIALLRYYSSNCRAHGTYILTVAIAIFTSLEVYTRIIILNETLKNFAFSFILSVLLTIGSYWLVRLFFWGYLATPIMWVKPLKYEDTTKNLKCVLDKTNINTVIRLHLACSEYVKDTHETLSKFSKLRYEWLLLFGFYFLFSFFFVLPFLKI